MKLFKKIFYTDTWFEKQSHIYIFITVIFLLLPIIYWLVYATGGVKFVYAHTMYIPIVLAGIFIGPQFGIVIAALAGILLGPLMPLDTLNAIPQEFTNWFYRFIIFVLLGSISGFASRNLKKSNISINYLLSHNQETGLPNVNFLGSNKAHFNSDAYMISTLLIHNSNSISDALGLERYYDVLVLIYQTLKNKYEDAIIVQADYNKLWFIKKLDDINNDSFDLTDLVQNIKQVHHTPIYIDFTIGSSKIQDYKLLSQLSTYRISDSAAKKAREQNISYLIYEDIDLSKNNDFELISTFEQALNKGETYLVYQPKIDIKTMKPIGLEALIRWKHPLRGLIPPDQFIFLLEETKLIHHLTDWVLTETLIQTQRFIDIGIEVPISINISPNSMADPGFHKRMMDIIESHHISPSLIELEITEHVLMKNAKLNHQVLKQFSKHNMKISLDDFGTGYSSLAYLNAFDIDAIKLDKQFISKLVEDLAVKHIVKSTLDLAKNLGFDVIAEGVETKEQLDLLKTYDCRYAQGYYFAKPMNDEQIIKWYQEALK